MQKLKIFQSLWGMEQRHPHKKEPTLKENFKKAKLAGFDGICIDLSEGEIKDFEHSKELFDEFEMNCMINAFPNSEKEMESFLRMGKLFDASCINIISGITPLNPKNAVPIVRKWIEEAEIAEIKILFETHRDSLLNDLFFTIQLMDLVPEMRLCADLSHFVIDRELRLPLPDRDQEYINTVLKRSDCFQGRVANREQIQIQLDFPQHKEWVNQFKKWWRYGLLDWRTRNNQDAELIFLCELGPPPYAMTDKNQEELSDRWDEALLIKSWIEAIWKELSRDIFKNQIQKE